MKAAIIVRHGQINEKTGNLTPKGIAAVKIVAQKAALLTKNTLSKKIVTSPLPRAKETALVFSQELDAPVEDASILISYNKADLGRIYEVLKFLKKFGDVDLLVIVVHYEFAMHLPHLLSKEWKNPAQIRGLKRGEAVILDFDTQQTTSLQ